MHTTVNPRHGAQPLAAAEPSAQDHALYRKVSLRIIPFLFVCYVISFLDRINIGFAQLQMKQDLGFSDAMYGLGAAVFYMGYVLFEVPSNLLLERFGARKTFVRIMLLWGAASVCMSMVNTPAQFYALRFMLGVFEAGFFPGIVLYLTYWYPALRRASVLSYFFAGVAVAGVLGGLVSGWIMRDMAGVLGMKGWQWMFAIEGAPALLLAVIAHVWLDDRPAQAAWLSPPEKARLAANLSDELSTGPAGGGNHGLSGALSNPRIYLFAFVYFALTCASLTLSFWMPLMIRDFGVRDVVQVSLYSVIPNAIGAIGVLVIARMADRKARHRECFAVCALGGAMALGLLTTHPGSLAAALALLSLATALIFSALPIFWAIPTAYLPAPVRAGGIALISSVGITSGIAGPWAIGQIKTATGSMDVALYLLAGLLVLSAGALLAGVRPRS
ncbi:MFS transporter [Duganella sp. FT92W]|uniref:MFS transporter n=1 Tax=Pseudoduganella rivuli TaxID=2666085 RepID=A0A7X2IL16_9BURK|nr:MFS transporter [Pseudoduganella rivuli]MRV71780.1 MFS transporter [Pseudoduganella rivuli]